MTEESLLAISASIGEILRYAQNDGECIYVALLPARFFASLRMTEGCIGFVFTSLNSNLLHYLIRIVTLPPPC